jgi:hypothetical protein
MPKVKKLKYPFTYDEWLKHPSTKPKLKWIKELWIEIRNDAKHGEQLELFNY